MSIIAGNSHSFKSDSIFKYLAKAYQSLDATQKDRLLSQVSGVFEFHIQNGERKTEIFTVDLKQDGLITKGVVKKPDVIIYISDGDFVDFSRGRLNGQKAFMSGRLRIKGQIKLATKLDRIFKQLAGKSKL